MYRTRKTTTAAARRIKVTTRIATTRARNRRLRTITSRAPTRAWIATRGGARTTTRPTTHRGRGVVPSRIIPRILGENEEEDLDLIDEDGKEIRTGLRLGLGKAPARMYRERLREMRASEALDAGAAALAAARD